VLERLGGFRDEFSGPRTSGEDADLGWRALEAGCRLRFEPEALVHHVVWPSSWWAYLKDRPRWGMVVQVVRYHPEARRLVYHRYFWRASHARTLAGLAVLALAAAVRRWLPPALAATVMTGYLVKTRGSSVPAHLRALRLAQVFVADTVEVAVLARASVRYRTLLL